MLSNSGLSLAAVEVVLVLVLVFEPTWVGLWQRAAFTPPFLWAAIVAMTILLREPAT